MSCLPEIEEVAFYCAHTIKAKERGSIMPSRVKYSGVMEHHLISLEAAGLGLVILN